MTQQIIEALIPAAVALAVACGLLVLLVRGSGAKADLRRMRDIHRCEDGAVQSLAFVITLPLFLLIVVFIVQISQLMLATVVVHYSAFAAARSAIVWIPAEFEDEESLLLNDPQVITIFDERNDPPDADSQFVHIGPVDPTASRKLAKVHTAAVMACAAISPSGNRAPDIPVSNPAYLNDALAGAQLIYLNLAGEERDVRWLNKVGYAHRNTFVAVEWRHNRRGDGTREIDYGNTYNPTDVIAPPPEADPPYPRPNQVGWQDAVTVYVVHRYTLMPGLGGGVNGATGLGQLLVRPIPVADEIERQIAEQFPNQPYGEAGAFTIMIPAAATLTNEGLQSVRPYVHGQ